MSMVTWLGPIVCSASILAGGAPESSQNDSMSTTKQTGKVFGFAKKIGKVFDGPEKPKQKVVQKTTKRRSNSKPGLISKLIGFREESKRSPRTKPTSFPKATGPKVTSQVATNKKTPSPTTKTSSVNVSSTTSTKPTTSPLEVTEAPEAFTLLPTDDPVVELAKQMLKEEKDVVASDLVVDADQKEESLTTTSLVEVPTENSLSETMSATDVMIGVPSLDEPAGLFEEPNAETEEVVVREEKVKTTPAPIATKPMDHGDEYEWLRGRLEKVHVRGGAWLLRYASLGEYDKHGGMVVLARDPRLEDFNEGETVEMKGRIVDRRSRVFSESPVYRFHAIERVETN
ncbi:hypothetical protein Pan216_17390 [Planctomycetes bacterium Pan216]|uniref:Uncharacterized protein n=1 Tax=Kolteria novifilia TaxID=2527975 RepID=A0A518B1T9_9BACT|nr:hypothetical protein Pan216_17390 [Planctomycetes bacterium Pan216]